MEEANSEERNYFNDNLDFNAWQLTPAFNKQYSDIIGKDAPLSNISSSREMEYIDLHLRTATYLNGINYKLFKGFNFYFKDSEGEEKTVYLEVDSVSEGLAAIGKNIVLVGVTKVYEDDSIMKKTVHNKLSRAYTRMALSRGINGKAARDLKTIRHEEAKTISDLTPRGGWNPFNKNKSSWSEYEKQK